MNEANLNDANMAEHKKILEGVRQTMLTPEGKALLRHIIHKSRALHCDYSSDPSAMYYLQGQRSLGFELLNLLKEQNKNNLNHILNED